MLAMLSWLGPACHEDPGEPNSFEPVGSAESTTAAEPIETDESGAEPSDGGVEPTGSPADCGNDAVVEFRIEPGTGSGAWNSRENILTVRVGQVLRIHNDDVVGHTLHTYGAPVEHGEWIEPGAHADHEVIEEYDPGSGPPWTYGHEAGESAAFWLRGVR